MTRLGHGTSLSFLLFWLISASFLLTTATTTKTANVVEAAKIENGQPSPQKPAATDVTATADVEIDDENDILEVNPGYNEEDDNDNSSDGESDEDIDEDISEDEEEEKNDEVDSTKKSISKALKKTRGKKMKMKLSKSVVVSFLNKNKAPLTAVVVLFAFRKELSAFVSEKIAYREDVTITVTLADIVKLIIFVEFIRRVQSAKSSGDGSDKGISSALLSILMRSNPLLGLVLSIFGLTSISESYNPALVPKIDQHYAFERMNEMYIKDGMALEKSIQSRPEKDGLVWPGSPSSRITPSKSKNETATKTSSSSPSSSSSSTTTSDNESIVVVLDWTGLSSSLPNLKILRDQVSFLLSEYRKLAHLQQPKLEVVLLLESPGGQVSAYGLAASQLLRLRQAEGITLTICVDTVAASGGYMLACTASEGQLIAAPFALVGSIGVIGQILNVQDLLKNWGIQPLVFRGGKDKAPIGLIGEITSGGKAKTQEMIDATHRAFRKHVLDCRPDLATHIKTIGDGDVWLASDAQDLGLVDQIKTSDEYIGEKVEKGHRVLKMLRLIKHTGAFGRTSTYATASLVPSAEDDDRQRYSSGTMVNIPSFNLNTKGIMNDLGTTATKWIDNLFQQNGSFGAHTTTHHRQLQHSLSV
mmetsp:Transcript_58339/g.142654  ORF Transcript_58339/g.142654 Transcript_58339/m.142654 type:complete len:644 (+) Transcript_58339:69-2000(+)